MIKINNYSKNEVFYATKHSAGFDISASCDGLIPPHQWRLISTGLYIEGWEPLKLIAQLPDSRGYTQTKAMELIPQIQIVPRSGLALSKGVTVLNSPGTIDCDYTKEIQVMLINHGEYPFIITKGDRIAQGVMTYVDKVEGVTVKQVDRLSGFGSTGV